jgi:hypothetical protein
MTARATEWLGPHRAHEGGVTKLAGDHLNDGARLLLAAWTLFRSPSMSPI